MTDDKTYRLYKEKEKNKDEGYHKFWGKHILHTHLTWRHFARLKMAESYQYFNGTNTDHDLKSLFDVYDIKSTDGDTLSMPVIYVNLNKIRNRVKLKLGEFSSMGFNVDVQAINDSARTERTRFKMRALQQMKIKPYLERLAAESGVDYAINNELPDDISQFESFMKNTYKQNTEIVIEACLRYNIELYRYLSMRVDLLADAIIAGECHAKAIVKNDYPVIERCNPLMVGYGQNINNDDFLHLSNIFFEFYYLDVNQVLATFPKIKKSDIDDLIENQGADNIYSGLLINQKSYFNPFNEDRSRVLVFEARWIDTKKIAKVESSEEVNVLYGKEAEKKIPDVTDKKIDRKRIGWTRKVTLIGGELVADFGACEYMLRNPEKPAEATHEYCSFKPYNIQGQNQSDVDVMKPLQGLIDWILTKIQLEITKSGGSAIAIDSSKIPTEWGDPTTAMNTLLYHLKSSGLIVYNGAQGETLPTGSIPVQRFDTGLGASINGLMAIFAMFDQQLEEISGTTRSQMGAMASANQLKSVTQINLHQSTKLDKPLYDKFLQFENNLLSKHAHHIRMTWHKHPERYKHIIGDLYYMFLEQDIDMIESHHQIFVKTDAISFARLQEFIMQAIAHGMPAHEALQIELKANESIKEAVMDYTNKMETLQQRNAKMQQESQAQALSAQQQMKQGEQQHELEKIRAEGEEDRKTSTVKSVPDLQKTEMKEQAKKGKNEIELLKLMQELKLKTGNE